VVAVSNQNAHAEAIKAADEKVSSLLLEVSQRVEVEFLMNLLVLTC
jgi:hypothetical protein